MTTIHQIGHVVAREFGLTLEDLKKRSRKKRHVIPRWCAIHLAHMLTDKSIEQIARVYGLDWTTIRHALKQDIDRDMLMQIWCQTPQSGFCAIAITESLISEHRRGFLQLVNKQPIKAIAARAGVTTQHARRTLNDLNDLGLVRPVNGVWIRAGWAA